MGVPYINPAIKGVLDKFNMQKQQEAAAAAANNNPGATTATTTLSPSGVPRSIIVNNILNPSGDQSANKGHTVKIITVNSSSAALNNATNSPTGAGASSATVPGVANKRFLIINSSNGPLKTLSGGAGTATSINASPNIVKIVNISQLNGGSTTTASTTTATTPGLVNSNRLIMIKTQQPQAVSSPASAVTTTTHLNGNMSSQSQSVSLKDMVLSGEACLQKSLNVTAVETNIQQQSTDSMINSFATSEMVSSKENSNTAEADSISMSDMVNDVIKIPTIEEVMGVNASLDGLTASL